ncbi:M20 aminoacylase family protein [Sneathiella litorea]|uniref:Amidohydrolase n=1 Tax=Sneathiella litorea TaxID=2606216 RepID=A0A6L8W5J4_9PROT|nr:M20 aminoacylase family protein [Sneathiella litorea]MZR30415.1 amidohydrolase [Sneathiella litorea]
MTLSNTLDLHADPDFINEIKTIRRDIHQHPETAFEETRTSDIVARELEKVGIEVSRGLARTGVIGTLRGKLPGDRVIGLRADMDALFIHEANEFSHKSVHEGKMHACGHDGHTSMLLGAARQLAKNPDFAGTIHFIFQPAEESEGGARVMIEEGLFEQFPCDAIYGMHNMPGIEVGHFAICPGPMMAAGDTWEITFVGTGGHGAMPHNATDPTMAAGSFISSVSTILGRNVPTYDAAVISIGHIAAGDYNSPNIIPARVLVRGTARSYKPNVRDLLEKRLQEIAEYSAAVHNCQAEFNFIRRYPPLVNWEEQTAIAAKAAAKTVGAECVDSETNPIGGSEDFSFMLEKVPGAYILTGNGVGEDRPFVHNASYDFNDEALPVGIAYWINLVKTELGG